ncbi:multiple coagulation factor deficiency protein 2 [Contarinia nasturtii]|uniref:multiple coagulation factor deficiency protein 2 n=1 Tax=Contarinia nasturtii TaxID=265458 RepID=UPI0012D3BA54|nr:multiple coagulation factor deficiency protein 2 [Contarinia nasturtii]
MQQIDILNNITRRINITRRMIGIFLLYSLLIDFCYARGPHHPKSEKRRADEQQHINEHLAFNAQHIQEDLNAHQHDLPNQKNVEEMTEEERNYMYFKVHDLDNNDKLDGLEIFYSATHHSASEDDHEHDKGSENNEASGTQEDQTALDNSSASNVSNLKLLELDENGQIVNQNINHIIDVLDNFLNLADLNNDGYLNYAEYTAAVKLGNAVTEEQHPEL